MRLIVILSVFVLLSIQNQPVFAYFENYPPYMFNEGPPIHINAVNLFDHEGDRFKSKDGTLEVRIKENEDGTVYFHMENAGAMLVDGTREIKPFAVYKVDLDGNGLKDIIVISWNGGTGLAGFEYTSEIYLTEKAGLYHKITYTGMSIGPEDFVDLNKDGNWEIIVTQVYSGEKHNYFSYNVFKIVKFKLVNANDQFKGFPKFVWMTNKPNDKDTTHLKPKERLDHVHGFERSISYELINAEKRGRMHER